MGNSKVEDYLVWLVKTLAAKALVSFSRRAASGLLFLIALSLLQSRGKYRDALQKLGWGTRGVSFWGFRGNSVLLGASMLALAYFCPVFQTVNAALWWMNVIVETVKIAWYFWCERVRNRQISLIYVRFLREKMLETVATLDEQSRRILRQASRRLRSGAWRERGLAFVGLKLSDEESTIHRGAFTWAVA